jgi:hypothetical protein
MTTTFLNGNSKLLVEHHSNTYILKHPCGGGHKNWQDSIVASSPEDFLKLYLNKNLNRISAQPKRVAENVKTVLGALCSA